MIQSSEPTFDASERAVLSEIDGQFRAQGWAEHVTVDWLLQEWRVISEMVGQYSLTIDDYTNDLTGRDGLEFVLANCQGPLRAKLEADITRSDEIFLAGTEEDATESLGQFFRIDASSGWWWRRKPATGALADYLSA